MGISCWKAALQASSLQHMGTLLLSVKPPPQILPTPEDCCALRSGLGSPFVSLSWFAQSFSTVREERASLWEVMGDTRVESSPLEKDLGMLMHENWT